MPPTQLPCQCVIEVQSEKQSTRVCACACAHVCVQHIYVGGAAVCNEGFVTRILSYTRRSWLNNSVKLFSRPVLELEVHRPGCLLQRECENQSGCRFISALQILHENIPCVPLTRNMQGRRFWEM